MRPAHVSHSVRKRVQAKGRRALHTGHLPMIRPLRPLGQLSTGRVQVNTLGVFGLESDDAKFQGHTYIWGRAIRVGAGVK